MDIADLSDESIARELDAAIAAASGIPGRPSARCGDCGEVLAEHRRERGRCIECQARREIQQRHYAAGV